MRIRHRTEQFILVLLCLFLLASGTGCSYAIHSCFNCSSMIPEEMKEQFADTVDELSAMAQQGKQPAAEEYQKDPGLSAANNAFQSLDRELFTWYVTSDIVTFDQYCYDPVNFGIDKSSVPVTLGDLSQEGHLKRIEECRNWLTRLRTLDAEHLGEQNRMAYDNYIRYLENEIAYEDFFYYYEPLEQYTGLQTTIPLTFALYRFKDAKDIENYLALLSDLPRYLGQVLAVEQKRAELGLFMTETMLDSVLEDLDSILMSGSGNYLYTTFRESVSEAGFLNDMQKADFYERNDSLLSGVYSDAFRSLWEGLEKLRPYCREMKGMDETGEKAAEYFSLRFRTESAGNLSVQQGIDELDQFSKQLYETLKEAYRKSSGKEQTFSSGTVQGNERYLRSLVTEFVPAMPSATVEYLSVPAEIQEGFGPAAYLIPASDRYMENTILMNPSAQTDLFTLAHEGIPGHMFQYVYQYSLGTIPLFQMVIEPLGYAEGWAKHAEYNVAKRADIYGAADCCSKVLNQDLVYVISARCSLLVNGNHASKQSIADYLRQWGLEEHTDEIYEISVNLPFYYFKYAMGFCQQYRIEEKCRSVFSYRDKDFYTEYLSWGPSCFDLLEPKLLAWAKLNEPAS